MIQRNKRWLILSIVASIVVITAIVVPTTVILIKKTNPTTTTPLSAITETTAIGSTTLADLQDTCRRRFSSIANYTQQSYLFQMRSADIDGNNMSDIILAGVSPNIVHILFNEKNGEFLMQTDIHLHYYVWFASISTMDVNKDNQIDIIVLDYREKFVVLLNQGNRTFIEHMNYSVDYKPSSLTVADINNDSYPDVIIGYEDHTELNIYFNDGTGTFLGGKACYHDVCRVTLAIVGDVNYDDNIDIISICTLDNKIISLLNTGNGTFVIKNTLSTEERPTSAAMMDVDNDQKLDLIVGYRFASKIVIYVNDGHAQFTSQTFYSIVVPHSVIVGDVNDDTKLDIVVANLFLRSIDIFLKKDNDAFFTDRFTYQTPTGLFEVAIADINNDNQLDIIVGYRQSVGVFQTDCHR